MYLLSEKFYYVVSKCKYHKSEYKNHADDLHYLQEFVAWLAAGDDFIKREHYVTAVKCRNRNEVHHAKHYRKQGRNIEEEIPVPV